MIARLAGSFALASLLGCGQQLRGDAAVRHDAALARQAAERQAVHRQVAARARQLELVLAQAGEAPRALVSETPLHIIGTQPGPVPDFELRTPDGFRYSSQELVGRHAFVVAFFATWCGYCEVELRSLQEAVKRAGPMPIVPVSADGNDTWPLVEDYLASFGIRAPAVRGHDYPRFAAAYDPFDIVPALVVVGRDGSLVDYHVGYDPANAERLASSLSLAREVGPLSQRDLSRPAR